MADFREEGRIATASRRRCQAGIRKRLGTVYGQQFYAMRYLPPANGRREKIPFPFAPRPCNVLLYLTVPLGDEALKDLGLGLLRHGMRHAVCCGCEAETAGETFDILADDYDFHHDGRTVFSSVHEDETLTDVMDYFILPADLADTGLVVAVGEEPAFRECLRAFATVAGEMRETLYAEG